MSGAWSTTRYTCPLCAWYHDEPIGPPETSPETSPEIALQSTVPGEKVRAAIERLASSLSAQRANKINSLVSDHLQTHSVSEFVARIVTQRDTILRIASRHRGHGEEGEPCRTMQIIGEQAEE